MSLASWDGSRWVFMSLVLCCNWLAMSSKKDSRQSIPLIEGRCKRWSGQHDNSYSLRSISYHFCLLAYRISPVVFYLYIIVQCRRYSRYRVSAPLSSLRLRHFSDSHHRSFPFIPFPFGNIPHNPGMRELLSKVLSAPCYPSVEKPQCHTVSMINVMSLGFSSSLGSSLLLHPPINYLDFTIVIGLDAFFGHSINMLHLVRVTGRTACCTTYGLSFDLESKSRNVKCGVNWQGLASSHKLRLYLKNRFVVVI